MGGAVSAGEDNDELIDNLVDAEYIKSPHIESIFRAVDRGHYYTDGFKEIAYRDLAWKNGNLHLSAPCIYSEVMESLKLKPGLSFLNIGSGTGYLSTMVGLVIGPYGISHGIELHHEVVDYANDKLHHFKMSSPAMDKYEFCDPTFAVGNCLNIDTLSMRQYDRVYCGASCPPEHENYFKNLIKVDGILVMPLNDQLLQIRRTSDSTWDVKTVLPVSFALLVVPGPKDEHRIVKLPDTHPLSLKDICRSAIRVYLRKNAEKENPMIRLKLPKKRKPRKSRDVRRNTAKRCTRRIVIPIFEESDGTSDDSANHAQLNGHTEASVTNDNNSLSSRIVAAAASSFTAVFSTLPNVRNQDNDHAPNHNALEEEMSKMEKFEFENDKCEETNDVQENDDRNGLKQNGPEYGMELVDDDSDDNELPLSTERTKRSIGTIDYEDIYDIPMLNDEDSETRASGSSTSSHLKYSIENFRRATGIIFKRVALADFDSDSDNSSCDIQSGSGGVHDNDKIEDSDDEEIKPEDDTESYSYIMPKKINELPLPHALQLYLNYYRVM